MTKRNNDRQVLPRGNAIPRRGMVQSQPGLNVTDRRNLTFNALLGIADISEMD